MSSCPTPEQLSQLATGILPEPQAADVESHVLQCPACQQVLSGLQLGDAFIEQVRGAALQPPPAGLATDDQILVQRLIADANETDGPGPRKTQFNQGGDASSSASARFRILRPHARGGLGEVFVAHDNELGREVALKEIHPDWAHDPNARSRFTREAEITGGLEHPGIVPVYGLGAYPDGRPFYAMRFVRGHSLNEAISEYHREGVRSPESGISGRDTNPKRERGNASSTEKNLQLRRLLQRFIDVCEAIEYAHARAVLHRDIKPDNIMLGRYGETLVVDWGLAKPLAESSPPGDSAPASAEGTEPHPVGETPLLPASHGSAEQTGVDYVIGTPAYMSPEQAQGRIDLLGPASDVFSLGATLYHILTGRAPYASKDAAAKAEFPRPRSIIPAVPLALEAICLKALSARPESRYASAKAMADDVEHFLGDEPVTALPEPLMERLARWSRRHRPWVRAGMAALLLCTVGFAIAWSIADTARRSERKARELAEIKEAEAKRAKEQADVERQAAIDAKNSEKLARETAQISERQARAATEFLVDIFAAGDPIFGFHGRGVARGTNADKPFTARDLLDAGRKRVRKEFAHEPATHAALLDSMGFAYLGLGELDSAHALLSEARQIRSEHPDLTSLQENHFSSGLWAYFEGDFEESEEHLQKLLHIQEVSQRDTLALARTQFFLAIVLGEQQRYAEAEKLLNDSLAIRTRLLGRDHPDVTIIRVLLVLAKLTEPTAILEVLKTLDVTSPQVTLFVVRGVIQFNSIRLLRDQRRFDEAVAAYGPLLAETQQVLGPGHPVCLPMRFDIAGLMQQQGDYLGAEKMARETLANVPPLLANNSRLAIVHFKLAQLARDRGDDQEAERCFKKAMSTGRHGNQHFARQARSELAGWKLGLGHIAEAESIYQEAVLFAKDDPAALIEAQRAQFSLLVETGKLAEATAIAKEVFEQSWAARATWPDSVNVLARSRQYVYCLRLQADYSAARRIEEETLGFTREMAKGLQPEDKPEYMRPFAAHLAEERDWNVAEQLHRWIAAGERKRAVPRHPDLAAALNPLPRLLLDRQASEKYQEAVDVFREILDIRRARFGEEHLQTSAARVDLSSALLAHRETKEAEEVARGVYDLLLRQYGPEDFRSQDTARVLSRTLRTGQPNEAEALLREVLTTCRRRLPNTHSRVFEVTIELGDLLADQPQVAAEHYQESLQRAETTWPKNSWRRAEIEGRLGDCYSRLQRFAEAEPLLLSSLKTAQAAWPMRNPRYSMAFERVIRHYEAAGDSTKADMHRRLLLNP